MKSDELKNIKHIINGDYIVIPIETGYIKPNENLNSIIYPAKELMEDGDYLVIAEQSVIDCKISNNLLEQISLGICFGTCLGNQRTNHQESSEVAGRDKST